MVYNMAIGLDCTYKKKHDTIHSAEHQKINSVRIVLLYISGTQVVRFNYVHNELLYCSMSCSITITLIA